MLPAKRPGRPAGKATEVPVTAGESRGPDWSRSGRSGSSGFRGWSSDGCSGSWWGVTPLSGPPGAVRGASRYLVYASEPAATVVACVQFSSAAWHGATADWMGGGDAGAPAGARDPAKCCPGSSQEPRPILSGRAAAGGGLRGRGVFGGDAFRGAPGIDSAGSACAERGGEAETGIRWWRRRPGDELSGSGLILGLGERWLRAKCARERAPLR